MNLFLIFTGALAVSIDSFICGFSLAFLKTKKIYIITGIVSIVLILCIITNYLGNFLQSFLTENFSSLGGIVLIIIGFFNLFSSKDNKNNQNKQGFALSIASGFAVGIDGAIFNLSLSLMGIFEIYIPFLIAFTHALTIFLGIILARTKIFNLFIKYSFIPPLILIALGFYKFILFFI